MLKQNLSALRVLLLILVLGVSFDFSNASQVQAATRAPAKEKIKVSVNVPEPSLMKACASFFTDPMPDNFGAFGRYSEAKELYKTAVAEKLKLMAYQAETTRLFNAAVETFSKTEAAPKLEEWAKAARAEIENAPTEHEVDKAFKSFKDMGIAEVARVKNIRRAAEQRRDFLKEVEKLAGSEKGAEDLRDAAEKLAQDLNPEKTTEQARQLIDQFMGPAKARVEALKKDREHREAIVTKQADLLSVARKLADREPGTEVMVWAKTEAERINFKMTVTEAEQIMVQFRIRAEKEIGNARVARHERELRFDIKQKNNSGGIVKAFLKMGEGVGSTALGEHDLAALPKLMEANPVLKRFVYEELQVARSYKRTVERDQSNPKIDKNKLSRANQAIQQRLNTDIGLMNKAVATGKFTDIHRAIGLRAGIRRINSPKALKGALGKGTGLGARMDALHRESLLIDALKSEELAGAIIGAGAKLPEMPKPPAAPPKLTMPDKPNTTVPAKPVPPNRPTRFTSKAQVNRYKAEVAQYKTAVERFKAQIQALKDGVANYKQQATLNVANHKIRIEQYKRDHASYVKQAKKVQARSRTRAQSRAAFLGYSAMKMKDLPIQGRKQILATTRAKAQRASKAASQATRNRVDAAVQSSGISSDPYSADWFWFIYTGNPMWLLNHDIAMFQLISDGFAPHGDLGNSDLIQGYDTNGWAGAGAPELHIDDFVQQHSVELKDIETDFQHAAELPLDVPNIEMPSDLPNDVDVVDAPIDLPNDLNIDLSVQEIGVEASVDPDLSIDATPELDVSIPDLDPATLDIDVPSVDAPAVDDPSFSIPDVDVPSVPDVDTSSFDTGGGGGGDSGGGGGGDSGGGGGGDSGGGGGGDGGGGGGGDGGGGGGGD